ncbi:transcription initiation factor IIB [candidate division MSBL1 archaeon SCGC-AAA259I09]|uniref:Transcription initiation factor IIB n=1 Tax=candidate division MSBL1 archaeon SCGC-AAA259I09 TaxID=1698267 RepID=A0A133UQX3_9EURY|nr:transcription initiation factor IIB [candidate division MSBL1 archaeon SCGC-AAA259I09]
MTKASHSLGRENIVPDLDCPECQSSAVVRDYQRNIVICKDCGLILEQEIKDRGPDWRAFSQEERENKSRGGPPTTDTIHDKGLSTMISKKNRDAQGNKLSPKQRSQIYRLRKWQRRTRVSDSTERNPAFALTELDRMASQLGLSKSVQGTAARIYRQAVKKNLIKGRSMEGAVSASLYLACRDARLPRTLSEVAEISRVDEKEIGQTYRFIARELDLNLPLADPASYVSKLGDELGISGEAKVKAMEIIRKAREENITSGKSPPAIAAATIYIAARNNGEKRTQREVSKAADVTEVTVRNRYSEISEKLEEKIEV